MEGQTKTVLVIFILFLFLLNEVCFFYDELARQSSLSYFNKREKLKFRRCTIVFFCLVRKLSVRIAAFSTFCCVLFEKLLLAISCDKCFTTDGL